MEFAIHPVDTETDIHGNELTAAEREWTETNSVRLDSFAKTNWKSAAARERWQDVHEEITKAKYFAEWHSVLDDRADREAAIIHVDNYNREQWLERLAEHDLFYKPIRYSKPYDGFSHKHIPTDISDPERFTYAVISTDEDTAEEFREIEHDEEMDSAERHSRIGAFLGFPACCREFFGEVWLDGVIDPMYEVTCNSGNATPIDGDRENLLVEDPAPWTNILWRYHDLSFLTHIPCAWDCEHSIEIAKTRGEIMADHGFEETANDLWRWLGEPAVWTGHNAITHHKNRYMIGAASTSEYFSKKRIVWKAENEPGGEQP